MCRYGMIAYKPHLACFKCRKTIKRKLLKDINRDALYDEKYEDSIAKCPQCTGLLADMGLDFKSPKKTDVKSWKHLEDLYAVGLTFHSCGCFGPGYMPKDSQAIVDHLSAIKANYVKQRSFWARLKSEPKSQSEFSKDQNKNWIYYAEIPKELNIGTKNKPKYDTVGAQNYWTARITEVETKILQIKIVNKM